MKRGFKQIIKDAKTRGYIVKENNYGSVDINVSPRGLGVRLWPDGSATRNDVENHLALTIRTQKEIRKVLRMVTLP